MSNQNPHPRDMRHSQIPLGCLTPPHPLGLYIDRYIIVVLNNNSNNKIIIIIITIIMTIKKGFVTIDRQAHLY